MPAEANGPDVDPVERALDGGDSIERRAGAGTRDPLTMERSAQAMSWVPSYGRREDFAYDIFISYRRRDGKAVAEWLSRQLRRYRPPRRFDRAVEPLRIYRDVERERATPAIWDERIYPALRQSRFLLVVLTESVSTPERGGAPNWVVREMEAFFDLPQGSNVILVQAGGPPEPPAPIAARLREPGWIDLSKLRRVWNRLPWTGRFHEQLTAMAVPVIDVTDAEIPVLNRLSERDQRRTAWAVASVSALLVLIVSALAVVAWMQRSAAQREADRARAAQAIADDESKKAVSAAQLATERAETVTRQAEAARQAAIVRNAASLTESNPTSAALILSLLPELNPPAGALAVAIRLADSPLGPVLRGHQLWVSDAAFSPDGTSVVTVSGDGTARVWRTDGTGDSRVLPIYDGPGILGSRSRDLTTVAFHPDGQRILTTGGDGTERIWRVDGTGKPIVLAVGSSGPLTALFSHDGKQVLAGDGSASRIWRMDNQAEPVVLQGRGMDFSPDDSQVVTATPDGTIQLVRSDGVGVPLRLPARRSPNTTAIDAVNPRFQRARFSLDGRAVVVADGLGLRVWRFADGLPSIDLEQSDAQVIAIAFSPDSTRVVASGTNGNVRLWSVKGGEPIVLNGHTGRVFSAVFSGDNRRVLTAAEDGTARVWSSDGTAGPMILNGHAGYVSNAVFSPDGSHVVTAGADRTARVWNLDAHSALEAVRQPPRTVRDAAFNQKQKLIATAHQDGTVRLWRSDRPASPVQIGQHDGRVNTIVFSPDGQRVLTAGGDLTARIWRADGTGQPVVLKGHRDEIYSAVFSTDGQQVLTASDDWTAAIWRADGRPQPMFLRGHRSDVFRGRFNRQGTQVVTASEDGTARIWRVGDERSQPLVLGLHGIDVRDAAFSHDGMRVATGDAAGLLRLWQSNASGVPLVLRGHSQSINTVDFSPDDKLIVTASDDGTARLWRTDGSGEEAVLTHGDAVRRAVFTDDGAYVLTASDDGVVRLWLVDWARLRADLKTRTSSCLTDEERRRHLGESADAARLEWDRCEAQFNRRPLHIVPVPSVGDLPNGGQPSK